MAKLTKAKTVNTFSIVGFDSDTEELGIAVASKFLAVGAVVPYAKAGVGAIATQSWANSTYGPEGLHLLEQGFSPEEVIQQLTEKDDDRTLRQIGIVDAKGRASSYTGANCLNWAGGRSGDHFAVQGNLLFDQEVIVEMERVFFDKEGSLAYRLLAALEAGEGAGGDKRGKQSAALLVVKENGGYGGFNDRYIDLRVDDYSNPIKELQRLYMLQQLFFGEVKKEEVISIDEASRKSLTFAFYQLDYIKEQELTSEQFDEVFKTFHHHHTLHNRFHGSSLIDKKVMDYIDHLLNK